MLIFAAVAVGFPVRKAVQNIAVVMALAMLLDSRGTLLDLTLAVHIPLICYARVHSAAFVMQPNEREGDKVMRRLV